MNILVKYTLSIIAVFTLFQVSCNTNPEIEEETPVFSFAIAGHVYGNSDSFTSSVYPAFLNQMDSLTKVKKVDLLVLTGDVVARPTEENWETVRKELDDLPIDEWVIARGNHDISHYLDDNIQSEKYIASVHENCLFLVLYTGLDGWTVDSTQALFIKESLADAEKYNEIFVFTHQLWWEHNPPDAFQIDSVRPNSYHGFEGESDFWQDAFPYFENLNQNVSFFAGDMGCHYSLKGYFEDHFQNFHFYGSGMGGAVEDNYIYVQIFQDKTVKIERVDF